MKYSIKSYQKIIQAFLENGYRFLPFGREPGPGKAVFLRHDIDCCIQVESQMAEINRDLGVHGCFFINIRSGFFNLVTDLNIQALKRIQAAGQSIGLHFYPPSGFYPKNLDAQEQIQKLIHHDFDLFRKMVDVDIESVFSWHRPSVLGDDYKEMIDAEFSGFLNVNSLFNKGVLYKADSNHRYSVEEWLDLAVNGPDLIQASFHPFHWVLEADTLPENHAILWTRLIRQMEREFLFNPYYRERFPDGLPEQGLQSWIRPLVDRQE